MRIGSQTRPGRTRCTGRRSGSSAARTPWSSARTTAAAASAARWSTTPVTPRAFTPPTSRSTRATASAPTGRSATRTSSPITSGWSASCPSPAKPGRGGIPHTYPHGPHPVAGGALRAWEGARRLRDRDARRPGRHRQRLLRAPPALHLPRLLPAGLQGRRQGIPARHAHSGRARAWGRGSRRLHGDADRNERVRALHRSDLFP